MGNDHHIEEARKRGRALVQRGLITTDQLGICLKLMEKSPSGGPRIEDLLVQLGYISKADRARFLSDREAEEPPAPEAGGAAEPPSSRRRSPGAEKPSEAAPPAGTRRGAGSRRVEPRAEEKHEPQPDGRREPRTGTRGPPARGKKKVKLSRRSRLIQFAIFFSPVVVLAGVIGWKFFGRERPVEVREAPGPAAQVPRGPDEGRPPPADAPGPDRIEPPPRGEEPSPEQEAQALFDRGLADLGNRELSAVEARASMQKALDYLDRKIEREPDSFEARLLSGRTRSLLGDAPGALVDLDFAVEARPQDPRARMARAAERFRMHWREMVRLGSWWEDPITWPHQKHLDGVVEDCRVVLASGDPAEKLRARPYLAFATRDPAGAMGSLKQIPDLDTDLLFFRGILLHWSAWADPACVPPEFTDFLTGALASYQESIERRWHSLDTWIHFSTCLQNLGRSREAVEHLVTLTQLLPEDPWLQYALGRVYLLGAVDAQRAGNLERATALHNLSMSTLDRTLALDPGFVDARALRANILRMRGQVSEAGKELDIVLKANDRNILALHTMASLLAEEGHPLEAARTASRALDLRPDIWQLYFVLESSLDRLGERDQARQVLERLLARSPPPNVRAKAEELLRK